MSSARSFSSQRTLRQYSRDWSPRRRRHLLVGTPSGHQTAQMTMRYAHLSPGFLRAEMARTEATVDVEAGAEAGTFQHPLSTEGVESTSAAA